MISSRQTAILTLSTGFLFFSLNSMGYDRFANGKTEIELGVEVSGSKYNETIKNTNTGKEEWFMSDTGAYLGVAGSFAYYGNLFLKFDTVMKAGAIHYESNGTGSADHIVDYIVDTRGLVGVNFCRDQWRITPYTGIGFRYLYDNSLSFFQRSSTGAAFYNRESNYIYSPLGIELQRHVNHQWDVGGVAEFDIFWRGFQESHLEEIGETPAVVVNKQNGGYGVRMSIRAARDLTHCRKLVIEPYYRYWHICDSELYVTGNSFFMEPDNTTNELGLKVAILF